MDPQQRMILMLALQNQQVIIHAYHDQQQRRRRRRRRRWWVRPWIARRPAQGIYSNLMVELRAEDPASFVNYLRMPPEMFDELLTRLRPRLTKQATKFREPLDPGLKLALTLRHLASGAKYRDMQYAWRVPYNTMSITVKEVCQAILDEYRDELMSAPTTEAGWRHISDEWMRLWNFPHVIGAIDGKHVACRAPPSTGSQFYNYKGFFSIILLAVVTADYKFLWVDTSGDGSASDAQVYNQSDLRAALEAGDLIGWPAPDPLPHDTEDVPYFLIGDDAFALRPEMMKPYGHRDLTHDERIFNYRLSRARRVVENSFGILVNRFQVLLTTMNHLPSTVRLITKTCILLHNLMRTRYPVMQNRLVAENQALNGGLDDGEWRVGRNLADVHHVAAPNRATRLGKMQRNLLKHWVNSPAGSVEWQEGMV